MSMTTTRPASPNSEWPTSPDRLAQEGPPAPAERQCEEDQHDRNVDPDLLPTQMTPRCRGEDSGQNALWITLM